MGRRIDLDLRRVDMGGKGFGVRCGVHGRCDLPYDALVIGVAEIASGSRVAVVTIFLIDLCK